MALSPETASRLIASLLRLAGSLMLLAFAAIVLPSSWMAATHGWLGLGQFPASPLVEYLTRSISALYGIHGGLCLVVARDVRRHADIVTYLGWMNILFGVVMVGIDQHARLPSWWTVAEGPPIAVFGVILLVLKRASGRDAGHPPA